MTVYMNKYMFRLLVAMKLCLPCRNIVKTLFLPKTYLNAYIEQFSVKLESLYIQTMVHMSV